MIRAVVFALLSLCLSAAADTITGRVVGVSDGDTVTVLDSSKTQHKIRLAGIDAPEKAQPYGQKSKESLSELVYQQNVLVEFEKIDRYGRKVGKILLGNRDINLEQIRRGLAWHYKAFEREQSLADRAKYAEVEDSARSSRRGLWQDPRSVPPWDHRAATKRSSIFH